jgi:hypothetical protein
MVNTPARKSCDILVTRWEKATAIPILAAATWAARSGPVMSDAIPGKQVMSKRGKRQTSREERLREALRENLKRRRAQARGREQAQQNNDHERRKTQDDEQS